MPLATNKAFGYVILQTVKVPELPFEVWKARLREDCAREDVLSAFDALDDEWLRLLWELELPPSVQGITKAKKKIK